MGIKVRLAHPGHYRQMRSDGSVLVITQGASVAVSEEEALGLKEQKQPSGKDKFVFSRVPVEKKSKVVAEEKLPEPPLISEEEVEKEAEAAEEIEEGAKEVASEVEVEEVNVASSTEEVVEEPEDQKAEPSREPKKATKKGK